MTSRHIWSGETAREARKKAGLSPEAVADAVGAHRASVYGWEAGREPQMRHALALADLYGVSIESFFIHDPDGTNPGANGAGSEQEVPAHANAPAAVVPGAENAGSREGALIKE